MPDGYQGQFGPNVKALVISLYYAGGMSEPKIIGFVEQMGVNLSKGIVSTWLSGDIEAAGTELRFDAGMLGELVALVEGTIDQLLHDIA